MHLQKRTVNCNTFNDSDKKTPMSKEQKPHKYWLQFMNERVIDRAYVPTTHEHAANCLTHGCLIIPSFIAARQLIYHAKTPAQYWSSLIYGNALIFLFSSSTIFHCSCFHPTYRDSTLKHFLHRVDRAIIYIFICASYTPWLLLRPTPIISTIFSVVLVWTMGMLGITYQILYHEKYKWLETCFYVIVGVLPAIVVIDMTDHTGVFELAIGGLVFLCGIFFFKCDGIIPFAHSIWHCFVFFGAAIHYYAIYTYLLVPPLSQDQIYSRM
ncbi:unnamed protein product [Rotaria magnacalcarata]|uniref:Uncharacterized protein n=6 Tax=Rotaria magnacalcarata TaxID=392030 RepID=A0A816UYF8_9BILA|nr:unnamed protein product [Rotaria magnacalcarata]CAF1682069.1 unnamed protein product [Rotaria magnacalcarata]CAF1952923.1 unnamed protein product [Rotaria magnacalcarata]CAF2041325.1 unnamed protein product [Rotaria magnacalcarata]CAF2113302.1 unnamed protein product [Rotaria magnacalcarata]